MQLDYEGPIHSGWTAIATGTEAVMNGLLAEWDTSGLPSCVTTLRLRAVDKRPVRSWTEHLVSVRIGIGADLNNDKIVNLKRLCHICRAVSQVVVIVLSSRR